MSLIASRGARLLVIGLAGALTALTGCQDHQKMDTAYVSRSSTGESIYGPDRGPSHNAPYVRSGETPQAAPAPAPEPMADKPAPAPKPAPKPRYTGSTVCAPSVPAGYAASGLAFPTGDAASSAIMVHQVMPNEVSVNEEFMYEYHLCNLTDGTLQNVALMVEDTQNLQIVRSEPAGSTGGGRAMWNLGDLGPRETTVVKVWARAGSTGIASNCISVSYNNVLCAQTRVVQPALSITKTATAEAMLCENIEYVFEIRNTGTGVAKNVRLQDTFPAGVTADGKSSIDLPIGDLAAGEGKRVTISAKAARTGRFDNNASAVADGGLTAQSGTASTNVTAPALEIAADCSGRTFIGRNFTHSYTVRNTGNGECNNTSVVVNLPAGTQFVRASTGGVQQGSAVSFDLGNVPAGAQRTVSVTLSASQQGDFSSSASVSCVCAEAATESCTTAVRGIPALLLEVIDVEDPDEVGTTEEYIITVTNQGSAPATGIRIVAQLPAEQEYVADSGATKASVSGRTVSFAPFGPLAPKAKAEWKVTVRCVGEGDVRFAVEMTADQLTRPVNETESTNLYR